MILNVNFVDIFPNSNITYIYTIPFNLEKNTHVNFLSFYEFLMDLIKTKIS